MPCGKNRYGSLRSDGTDLVVRFILSGPRSLLFYETLLGISIVFNYLRAA